MYSNENIKNVLENISIITEHPIKLLFSSLSINRTKLKTAEMRISYFKYRIKSIFL